MTAAAWSFLSKAATTVGGVWNNYQANQASIERAKAQWYNTKRLAAQTLALTYNNLVAQSTTLGAGFRRKVEALAIEERQAMGAAITQAAATGAAGRRVELAREQAITGEAERQKATIQHEAKTAQDELLRQAEQAEWQVVAQLMNSTPDIPASTATATFATGVTDILDQYQTYREETAEIGERTVSGGGGTGTGAQAVLGGEV